jgi:hypothetical protein
MADSRSFMEGALGFLEEAPFRLRYGVPAAEKYRLAVSGEIPGGRVPHSDAEVEEEERRAAGFLFGAKWPTLAEPGTRFANALRFWEDPRMHEIALEAARQGAASKRRRGASGSF